MTRLAELLVPARLGRSFRWLLASFWVTNLADGITLAAGPLLVASQTHNPLAVAMAVLLQRLPWLMFGLYAGVVADRVSRRAIIISTGLARAAILLLLIASILTHHVDTAVVLAALFLFGVNETFGDTTSQPRPDNPRRARVREDVREGWRWLWNHPAIRTLAITIFTFNVTFGAAWSVLVLYARERLGMSAVGFGLITTAMAVGGLLGSACYGWLARRVPLGVIMRGGLIIETLTHLALALTRQVWLALIIFAIFGAHAFIWGTTSTSVRQRAVPAEFQGRVGSVYLTGMVGGIVIGSALGGVVASWWGITAPFWFGFAGSAIILAFIWRSLLQIAHADESHAGAPAARL